MTNSPPPTLSAEELEQVQQTIEMFEVIVQANPEDLQSVEILKEAYQRAGRDSDCAALARKLGFLYMESGQFSSAAFEFEYILKSNPDDPEVIAALGDVEERMHRASAERAATEAATLPGINLDFSVSVADSGTLMATQATQHEGSRPSGSVNTPEFSDDGSEALAKFLLQHRLVPDGVVTRALEITQGRNRDLPATSVSSSLLHEILNTGTVDREALFCGILDRCKFAYIPLENYEVDRQVVKMLPEAITMRRLIIPFDVMSRTVMIATTNPFDSAGKEAVQQLLDYNVQWHLTTPSAIYKALSEAYRLPPASLPESALSQPGVVGAGPAPVAATAPSFNPPLSPVAPAASSGSAPLPQMTPVGSGDASTAPAVADPSSFRIIR